MTRFVPNTAVIRTEASAWVAQLETGSLVPADVEALREWTARSPRHAAELRRLARLSLELNALTEMTGPLAQAAQARRPIVRRRFGSKFLLPAYALASVLVVISLYWYSSQHSGDPLIPLLVSRSLETAVGEYEEYSMPDGSRISLNTGTQLKVSFDDHQRMVTLISGEALFTVARDENRPFIVAAGNSEVRALGTAFVVRYIQEEVEVSVTEGKVMMSSVGPAFRQTNVPQPQAAPLSPVVLEKGQSLRLVVNAPEKPVEIQVVSETDLRRKLAWREGLLDFHQTPLRQVVMEVSRHSGIKVIIPDEELQHMEYEGLFRVGETEKLLEALDMRADIEVEYLDADTVLLSLREVASDRN